MYKIPGRAIYCDTFLSWLQEMVWVYIVLKIFRSDIDAITEKSSNPPTI